MSLADYGLGLACFAVTVGAAGIVAIVLVGRRVAGVRGAARAVAVGVLLVGALMAIHLLPAVLGLLHRGTVVGVAVLAALGAWRFVPPAPRELRGEGEGPEPAPSGRTAWPLAATSVAVVAVAILTYTWDHAAAALTGVDYMTFHMPNVAGWIQSHTIWRIDDFVPGRTSGSYPNNGDLLLLAVALPWHSDFLARFLELPLLALTGLSVYALAVELRAPRALATALAATVAAIPIVLIVSVAALPDVTAYALLCAGLLFGVRHARTAQRSDLVMAGLSLGLACGTKWYAVYAVGAVIVGWTVARLVARQARRRVLAESGTVIGLVAAAGGFWLVRNWVQTGNPVFPAPVHVGGLTLFAGHSEFISERLSDYLDEPSVWRHYLWPQARTAFGLPTALLLAGGLAAVVGLLGGRGRSAPRGRVGVIAGAAAAVVIAVVYVFTPFSAQGPAHQPIQFLVNTRYVIPAVLLAGALAAWALGRRERWPGWLAMLVSLAALVAVIDGARRIFSDSAAHELRTAIALAGVALGAYVVWGVRERLGPAPLAVVLTVVLAGFAVGGRALERRIDRHRYLGLDPTVDWIVAHAPSGHRVGLAGFWTGAEFAPPLAMLGPRLANHVAYVGPHVDGVLRIHRRRRPFLAALRRGRFDLVLVQRGLSRPGPVLREERWARSVGYRPVAASPLLTLYRAPVGR